MNNRKITHKLILSFAILILLYLISFLFSLNQIHTITELTRTIYEHPLAVTSAARQSLRSVSFIQRSMMFAINHTSEMPIEQTIAEVDEHEKLVYQYFDIIRAQILGDEGKRLEKEIRTIFDNWHVRRDEIFNLLRKGQSNRAVILNSEIWSEYGVKVIRKTEEVSDYALGKASAFMNDAEKAHRRHNIVSILSFVFIMAVSLATIIFTLTKIASAENELLASKQLLLNAIDNAPIGMMIAELNGKFHRVNGAFCQLSGYSEEEIFKIKSQDLFSPDDAETWPKILKALIRGETNSVKFEAKCVRKDGSIITVWLTTALLKNKDGQPQYFFTQIQDITDQKQAELALRESEEHYRRLFDQANEGLIMMTMDGKLAEVNQAFADMHGYTVDELKRMDIQQLDTLKETALSDRPETPERLQAGEVVRFEAEHYHKDGRTLCLNVTLSEIRIGDQTYTLAFHQDITEQKQMQARLLESQKMESVGTLAGGIAHDFNNILSSILGFTELAFKDADKGTRLEENLQEVYTAGKRARDLVRQILAFARHSEEEQTSINVKSIIKEVLKLLRASIPTTIEIRQNLESNSLILGHASKVHQLIMNLCTNAAQAMDDTGGVLEVGLTDVELDAHSTLALSNPKSGTYLKITISDTGPGIPPDIIGSIFDPYFTTKGVGKGTGLGLAMAHGIVESYGGKITVDSKLGQRTVFSIYLPITQTRAEHQPYEEETLPSGPERILFVDDEAPIAKMGRRMLENLGYHVTVSTDSIGALELFRSMPDDFDLIITDMTMPDMTGDVLAAEAMTIRPQMPVILCTGYSNKISEASAAEIGIKALVYKPVEKADIAKTIRNVLDDNLEPQTRERILFVDDEPKIRKLFNQMMADSGYEIIEASNGDEGLKLYRENQPDLVITDLVMPDKEGIETIIELKKIDPTVKIFAISGGGRNDPGEYLSLAKNLGAQQTFAKPIDWLELMDAINDILR